MLFFMGIRALFIVHPANGFSRIFDHWKYPVYNLNKKTMKKKLWLIVGMALLVFPACFLTDSQDWPEGDVRMVTPFVHMSDISSINEAYSAHSNCPWGFEHRGIDFMISRDHIPFQAVCNGKITEIEKYFNTGNGYWQVNVTLKYNDTFTAGYSFEPFSPLESDGDTQLACIPVSEGDMVLQGNIIGYLQYRNPGAHVDFNLKRNDQSICPENYFTAEAVQKIITLLHRVFPGALMCYQ